MEREKERSDTITLKYAALTRSQRGRRELICAPQYVWPPRFHRHFSPLADGENPLEKRARAGFTCSMAGEATGLTLLS